MVFASFRRYFSMRHQNSKIQGLYDYCKNIFSPSGTPAPSSQALHKLALILADTIRPADVGLKEEAADDDRGLGFFGVNQQSRIARWAKPITYIDIHESNSFTMCIFCFPTSSVIPLHDHPGMTVFSKLLYGSLHVKAYDWVEPPCIVESKGPGHARVRLAKLAVDKVLNAPCEPSVLYPKHGGNLHCFTAVRPCAMLDILAPPYKEYEGRKCTYYHDYSYSTFSAGNGPVCVGEEDEYAWLAETEPCDLYMNSGVYAGPPIKP
ncbi:plant cysteine oxidase 3 isoform X1 [Vicia villosa]|uniref:plant cysteine oxidase 3 isoform X1 n=1 Tax=Vicia villosa TaxID=3911 RepID=UPI00273CAE9D|nr:plant cysteine oxidase 3 isoform X1 [Vicia villosa]